MKFIDTSIYSLSGPAPAFSTNASGVAFDVLDQGDVEAPKQGDLAEFVMPPSVSNPKCFSTETINPLLPDFSGRDTSLARSVYPQFQTLLNQLGTMPFADAFPWRQLGVALQESDSQWTTDHASGQGVPYVPNPPPSPPYPPANGVLALVSGYDCSYNPPGPGINGTIIRLNYCKFISLGGKWTIINVKVFAGTGWPNDYYFDLPALISETDTVADQKITIPPASQDTIPSDNSYPTGFGLVPPPGSAVGYWNIAVQNTFTGYMQLFNALPNA